MNWIIVITTILICGQLWRMGGSGKKWARAIVFPALIALVKTYLLWSPSWTILYPLLYIPILWGMLSLFSYGLTAPPHKFVVWLFKGKGSNGNYRLVEIVTRMICGFFWSFAALIFALLTGNWYGMVMYTLFLVLATGFIGGTSRNVEISERLVGASVAVALLI